MERALWQWDAVELATAIRTRKISSREAVQSVLQRLDAVNPALNAVTVLLADQALVAADRADAALKRGEVLGPLHGVPVTVKENIDQADQATANGVIAFKDLIAKVDSPPVANWKRAGAVIVGRTNTPAFSLRWHTDNELRGRTYNPWARTRTPGGSSGGAAAAVAAGVAPLAHGNDLGGSIRYPAYCCGVAGIRPTLGRVPAHNATTAEERPIGVQLMSVQGPLGRRVGDVRVGLAAMAARDPRDPWWAGVPLDGPPLARPIRVALAVDPARQSVHRAVAGAVRAAGLALAEAGYAVEEIEPPSVDGVAATWATLVFNEIRHMTLPYIEKHGGDELNRCTDLILAGIADVDLEGYMRALAERSRHIREWMVFMERYALVVGPVSAEPPFEVGFDVKDAETTARVLRAQRLLVAVNLLGFPAVAVPCGQSDGVPLGVQVIGGRYREDLCLDAAEVIEARHGLPTPIEPR
ncbi:MAG TPA: amidase family protein [Methylomirabilota bacterium]|nr:amidase family protein [Methylomirabilota bacterium]